MPQISKSDVSAMGATIRKSDNSGPAAKTGFSLHVIISKSIPLRSHASQHHSNICFPSPLIFVTALIGSLSHLSMLIINYLYSTLEIVTPMPSTAVIFLLSSPLDFPVFKQCTLSYSALVPDADLQSVHHSVFFFPSTRSCWC